MDGIESRLPREAETTKDSREEGDFKEDGEEAVQDSDKGYKRAPDESEEDDDEANAEGINDESSRSSSSDDDDQSSSGSEGDAKVDVVTTSDGRVLSQYELQREERIRRNREYLASLGLERPVEESATRQQRRNKRRPVQEKQRSSQRERKSVDYTERPASLASIVREFRTPKANAKPRKREPKPKESQKEKKDSRMERFIYREFQSIQAHKNQVLKQAEKDLRAAKREVKYWSKLAEKVENRERRREESSQLAEHGLSLRDILREVDNRTSELVDAVGRYDDELHAEEQAREQQQMRLVAEDKLKMLNALERFPTALKHSQTLLNAALLERAPEDPPPPRRSHRAARDDAISEVPESTKSGVSRKEEGERDASDTWGSTSEAFLLSSELQELKRVPRNVGGWVSPAFAEQLDRSWLDLDSPPSQFDPSAFVPQIGDCVLYYPMGHKIHLRHFPDVLGRQTADASRVPLWERVLKSDASKDKNSIWLSEEWLSKMKDDEWKYPILCRVEETHPEFPPDPYVKVVKSDDGDGEVLCWDVPKGKGSAALRRLSGTPLCLAVELRPLTSLIGGECVGLSPPPPFTVVTFPTELDPFLIPFTWAYASHCFSTGDKFTHRDDEDASTLRLEEFASLAGTSRTCRLEHRTEAVSIILSRLEESASKLETLKTLLAHAPPEFPLREGRYVIEVLRRMKVCMDVDASDRRSGCTIDLFQLIRETLPLWECAAVVKIANKRKQYWVSPWLLVPADEPDFLQDFTPSALSRLSLPLGVTLREKITFMVDDVWSRFEESDLFYYDISDSEAPSYGCAVPVKTSFEKIIRRLGAASQCYYRSVDEVLSDARMMWENCLLYNSPESPVVDFGSKIVAELRVAILRTVLSHVHGQHDAQRHFESSRCLLSSSVRHDGSLVDWEGSTPLPPPLSTVKNPYSDEVENDWLQHVFPQESATASIIGLRSSEQQASRIWIPQSGDQVLYSIENHKAFLIGHAASFNPLHCQLPCLPSQCQPLRSSDQENLSSSPFSWCSGTVLWTKATFPRLRSKNSPGDFLTSSTILAVCIKFQVEIAPSVVYWRPCLLDVDKIKCGEASCRACGLRLSSSFLRLSDTTSTELSEPLVSSLERCFNLLKRRCIKQESIATLDPSLTMENVVNGYTSPPVRIGPKSVPSYADMLAPQCKSLSAATRGAGSDCESESCSRPLVDLGFLPRWVASSLESAERVLKRHQMVSPCPKLSLELILLRLGRRFYRHTAAIENDVVEAYINQVALLISDATSRRKSPVSMRRIASGLCIIQDAWTGKDTSESQLTSEELDYLKHIAKIRDLHAMALFAVSETSHFERLLGLLPSKASSVELGAHASTTSLLDPTRARTRERIEMLLSAVAKDLVQRSSNRAITTKIVVRCGGEIVSNTRYFATVSRAEAILGGSSALVKVVCGGKLVTIRQEDFEDSGFDSSQELPTRSLNQMKVKVRCNDSSYGPQGLFAVIPGHLGDKSLSRVVESSIRCNRSEYEESSTLVRFLVGQPGRMDRCARCQAYQRSFYYCRVVRGHLNEDFDLADFFASGANGVDELLLALHPTKLSSTNDAESLVQMPGHGEGSIAEQASECSTAVVKRDAQKPCVPEGTTEVDPRTNLERARSAVTLAIKLLQDAALYSEAPARLSHEFISHAYPIDASDGHYVYCVICGLSGDLLCCDGCPNVVHQECINLADVPEGDWFCEECDTRRSAKASVPDVNSLLPSPFGRVHFDDADAERLAEVLAELYEARPDQKSGRADIRPRGRPRKNHPDEGEDDRDEEKGTDAVFPVDDVPEKRRRGRPRKQFVEIDAADESKRNAAASTNNSPPRDSQAMMPLPNEQLVSDRRAFSKASQNCFIGGQSTRSIREASSRRDSRQAHDQQDDDAESCRRKTRSSIAHDLDEATDGGAVKNREKRRSWRRSLWTTADKADVDVSFSPEKKRRKEET